MTSSPSEAFLRRYPCRQVTQDCGREVRLFTGVLYTFKIRLSSVERLGVAHQGKILEKEGDQLKAQLLQVLGFSNVCAAELL